MRKQMNGLIALVAGTHYMDPFEKALFFFTNKKRDKVCLKVHKTIAITAFRVENQPHLWYHKCMKNRQITKDLSSLSRNDSEPSVK